MEFHRNNLFLRKYIYLPSKHLDTYRRILTFFQIISTIFFKIHTPVKNEFIPQPYLTILDFLTGEKMHYHLSYGERTCRFGLSSGTGN